MLFWFQGTKKGQSIQQIKEKQLKMHQINCISTFKIFKFFRKIITKRMQMFKFFFLSLLCKLFITHCWKIFITIIKVFCSQIGHIWIYMNFFFYLFHNHFLQIFGFFGCFWLYTTISVHHKQTLLIYRLEKHWNLKTRKTSILKHVWFRFINVSGW